MVTSPSHKTELEGYQCSREISQCEEYVWILTCKSFVYIPKEGGRGLINLSNPYPPSPLSNNLDKGGAFGGQQSSAAKYIY